jgi:DNA-binding XRE family transcriptional regulator
MTDTITLSKAEYEALLDRLEDAEDALTIRQFNADVAERGWDAVTRDCLPMALAERLVAGEHPVRLWREHRGMTGTRLAELSGVPQSYISNIEKSRKPGSVSALVKLAAALDVRLDDLASG